MGERDGGYTKAISLINHIYHQNGRYVPRTFEDMVSSEDEKEFALYAFITMLETMEVVEE